jgi:hypothetical protein
MDVAVDSYECVSSLQSVNKIRMALNVIWLSDIATADGWHIDRKWLFPSNHIMRRNHYQWPKLHHINAQDWRVWRDWARRLCGNEEYRMMSSLGPWQCEQRDWVDTWDGFSTWDDEFLYLRSSLGMGWMRQVRMPGRLRHQHRSFAEYIICRELPEDPDNLKRVSYRTHRTYIEVISTSTFPIEWREADIHLSYWEHIEMSATTLLHKINTSLQPVFLDATAELNLLIRDYSRGTVVTVSDGSYFPDRHQAAAAWIIESECGSQWIMGSNFVHGSKESYSSYRSELMGLLAISVILRILACGCAQPNHVIIGCDGQAALDSLKARRVDINANSPHVDILSTLVDLWSSSTMKPYPVHVKGHQNENPMSLTRLEKLNVLMDKLATMTAVLQPNSITSWSLPSMGIRRVEYRNRICGGQLYQTLYNGITDRQLIQYYETKMLVSPCTMTNVAIDAFQHARSRVPTGVIKFISKWMSNTLATGVVLQRRQHRIFNRCPRCNDWGEDRFHVVVCWDVRADIIRRNYIEALQPALLHSHTDPQIIELLTKGLTQFFRQPNGDQHPEYPEPWKREQCSLGWFHFLSGFISKTMVQKQQEYYKEIGLRNKGKQWASKIIVQNWHLIYKLWLSRNEVLHQKTMIQSLSGAVLLDIEVEREYDIGYEGLPPTVHKWFQISKAQLLDKSIDYKRGWLLIVRTVREALNIADYSIFSSSRALRKWVGLNK